MLGKEVYLRAVPLDFNNITDEDIKDRVIEISERDEEYNSWKPYMFLKEVVGVDLINNEVDELGQTMISLQIKFMDEVKETAKFRRVDEYLDDECVFFDNIWWS